MNLGIIILAAGAASRMGSPKQVLDINGKSLLERVVELSQNLGASLITVVLGAHKELIKPKIAHLPLNIIENTNWENGMSSSIKMGLVGTYMIDKKIDTVLMLAGDMPALSREHFQKMLSALEEQADKSIFATRYQGSVGIPCLFRKQHFVELLDLEGDKGAAQIFDNNRGQLFPLDLLEGGIDLDTPEDYFEYLESLSS